MTNEPQSVSQEEPCSSRLAHHAAKLMIIKSLAGSEGCPLAPTSQLCAPMLTLPATNV